MRERARLCHCQRAHYALATNASALASPPCLLRVRFFRFLFLFLLFIFVFVFSFFALWAGLTFHPPLNLRHNVCRS